MNAERIDFWQIRGGAYYGIDGRVHSQGVAPGVTVASRHPRFAQSLRAQGKCLVHLTDRLLIDWRSNPIRFGARWVCAPRDGSSFVRPTDERPTCPRCALILHAEEMGAPLGQPSIYYATREGLIKIGHSTNVGMRMYALGAELLAVEPAWGEKHEAELSRHSEFDQHRHDGEWFVPSPELLSHIERVAVA